MATVVEELNDLLSLLEPADAEIQRTLIEKNAKFAQELKDGRLRQSDYSKFMNEKKSELEYAGKMRTWADENVPKHTQLVKDYETLDNTRKTLEQQVNDYREQVTKFQSGELNVDEAALDARVEQRVKALGYVTRADMDAIVKQEATKLAKEESLSAVKEATTKFLTETWPAAQAINSAIIMKSFEHLQEFGKPLNDDDLKGISAMMTERNIVDPRKAYDEWISPKRNEVKVNAEVERRVAEEVSKRAGFPGVSGVPTSEMGPMQQKAAGVLPELPGGVLGDNSAAMAAAKEFRSEGKY